MKILAIDTSSKVCSVAITEDAKKIIELHSDDEKTHSVKLMPMIDKALSSSHITLDDINLLVCSIGPGSFTGVRIGIATIKAFADTKHIPVVGVSSLEGLAYNAIDKSNLSNALFCSMIDAKNHNVYCGLFRYNHNCLNQITDLFAEDIDTVIGKIHAILNSCENQFNSITFVGDATVVYQDLLEKNFANINICFAKSQKNTANSVSIAISGYTKYINGMYGDSYCLSPLYLRKSQAERALEEKNN